ncbi:MAG TPA: PaaX family transcriptional regulator C-terminal domain-containing protein [Candidatus Dormibacteraeota bacterium]|nr:PaaX family transcriptional regulator C-terminal domain-containing protein [Candidatus Dormibacteraeota bacterium]
MIRTTQVSRRKESAMVPFLFGVAGADEIPGVVLVRLLEDLGLTASAARACIARLRGAGFLASSPNGRAVAYRLDGSFAEAFRRIRDGRERAAWTGAFHAVLYQVPEADRAFRDALRWSSLMSGYGQLQPGVLIALRDRTAAIAPVLERRPPGARVFVTRLAMDAGDAARAAHAAWDLDGLGALYGAHIESLERAAAVGPETAEPGAAALRRFADLARGPMTDTLRDPGLPAELLPADWAGSRLRAAIGRVNALFGPPAATYVRGLLRP